MGGSSTTFYFDQVTDQLIKSTNVAAVILNGTLPKIYRMNEHQIVRAYIYSDASTETKANLSGLTMSAKIGAYGTTALITANSASFNLTDDWALANVAAGQICFFINTCSAAVGTDIGTAGSKQYVCNINGNDSDGDDRTISQVSITLMNVPE